MESIFYKKRSGKLVSGVLAGLADKFQWDLSLVRILFAISMYFSFGFAFFLYMVLAIFLPYKEDLPYKKPGQRKTANPISDDEDDWFF